MAEEIHVLWITENFFPSKGGMAQSCDRIVGNLRNKGLMIDLVHLSPRAAGFRVDRVQHGCNIIFPIEEDPAHSMNLVWNYLEQAAQRKQWTHLLAFGGFLPILAAPLYAAWLDLPLVTLIRGNDFDAAIFHPRRRELLKEALLRSAAVCAVSQDKVQKIKSLYPEVNAVYTPNGIDLKDWTVLASDEKFAENWRTQHLSPSQKVIGLFGQLKAKKGVLLFLEALGHSGKSRDIHLLFIGDLNNEISDFLEAHPLDFNFTCYSFMDRYALLPYFAACDGVAIPSFYDGLPNVLMEAGGLGKPFIASRVAGMADVLDEQMAFLFKNGDVKDASRAIYEFIQASDQQLLAKGKACRQMVKEKLSHEDETRRYLEIFKTTKRTT